jgi:FKBP-type peptidyl-prolyl cis-trans isomerase
MYVIDVIFYLFKGWDEGVMTMSLGEKATLHISSDYGYGTNGAGGVIPPNADLDFIVELLAIGDIVATNIPKHKEEATATSCCVLL